MFGYHRLVFFFFKNTIRHVTCRALQIATGGDIGSGEEEGGKEEASEGVLYCTV